MGRSSIFQSTVANGVYGGSNSLAKSINANKIVLFAPKNLIKDEISNIFTKNNSSSLMKNFLLYGPTYFINNNINNIRILTYKVIDY